MTFEEVCAEYDRIHAVWAAINTEYYAIREKRYDMCPCTRQTRRKEFCIDDFRWVDACSVCGRRFY